MADADEYDEFTRRLLERVGVNPTPVPVTKRAAKDLPSTAAGLPGLLVRELPELTGSSLRGFVLDSPRIGDEMKNRGMQQNLFVAPKADAQVFAHEIEHLLARQNLGSSVMVRDTFYDLLGDNAKERSKNAQTFLRGLEQSLPYLEEKYGARNGYMTPKFIQSQGHVGLYELLATLGSIESSQNVDLTKDPELRKTLFSNPSIREAYSAVTGLRQTRLDPRDIPPYTKVKELTDKEPTKPGLGAKLKQMFGYASGGMMPNAGNHKFI